jgi:hypothetical protein
VLIFAGDISIRIEEHLDKMLTEAARQSGKNRDVS